MDDTFGNHNLLQTIALYQEFFIPLFPPEIIFFLDIDDRSVDAWNSLSRISVNGVSLMSVSRSLSRQPLVMRAEVPVACNTCLDHRYKFEGDFFVEPR
jgi:hypothetical protein